MRSNSQEVIPKPRIAMALSGGGFRAALFHLGVFRRLAELRWLHKVDVISTVSGGSIVGAFVAIRWKKWLESGGSAEAFEEVVTKPFIARVCERNLLLSWFATSFSWPWRKLCDGAFTRSDAAAEMLSDLFFEQARCSDLPISPLLVINATSLQSIRSWRFTRHGLGDSRIGYSAWNAPALPLGTAVCASASFPPIFPPLRIKRRDFTFSGPVYGEEPLEPYPLIPLTDGGVYDNAGLEVLIKSSGLPSLKLEPADFLVVSDGGAPANFSFRASGVPGLGEALLLYRADQISREQVTALRTRWLMDQIRDKKVQGLFVSIRSAPERIGEPDYSSYCSFVPRERQIPADLVSLIRSIRTSLDRFSNLEAEALMYHAYVMTDCFLWRYRKMFAPEYQVPDSPSPSWGIKFSTEVRNLWYAGLVDSRSAMRLR